MKGGTRTGVALAVGYVLGRRHKLRMAAVLAAVAASGRLSTLGGAAVKRGATMAGSGRLLGKVSPQLGGIAETVRGELINAGKAAAVAAFSNRIESLSDSLHQRADAIRGPGSADRGGEDRGEVDEDYSPDEDDRDEPEDRYGEDGDEDYEEEGEPDDDDSSEPARGRRVKSPVKRAGR